MKLYVGNLSYDTGEQQIEHLFAPLGVVESVKVIRDQLSGRSRGFGFVEMTNADEATAACRALDQREFEGRRLIVSEAKPQSKASGFGGGSGGRGREGRW
jgi:cold-inducible RNA-binding protein